MKILSFISEDLTKISEREETNEKFEYNLQFLIFLRMKLDKEEYVLSSKSFSSKFIDILLNKFVYNFIQLFKKKKKREREEKKIKNHSTNYLRLITLFKIASFCAFLVDVIDKSLKKRIAEGSKILSGGH